MKNGSIITVDGRPAVRFERRLPHSIDRVWAAVSKPEELGQWFPAVVAWTPAVGETFKAVGEPGEVTDVDPPRRLGWVWGGQRFLFELEPDDDGCRLTFLHVFDDLGERANFAAGWQLYLDRLDAQLAGRPVAEDEAMVDFPDLQKLYAADLDPGDDTA